MASETQGDHTQAFDPGSSFVVCCCGASLNETILPNLPVVAVSTAIRSIPQPDVWAFCDLPANRERYGDEGVAALSDHSILKVAHQVPPQAHCNLIHFHPGEKFKSSLGLALLWLVSIKADTAFLAGVDMDHTCSYGGRTIDAAPEHRKEMAAKMMDFFWTFAKKKKLRLISLNPNSPVCEVAPHIFQHQLVPGETSWR